MGCFFSCGCIVIIIIGALLGGAAFTASMIFDKEPFVTENEILQPDPQALQSASIKTQSVMMTILNPQQETAEITLTEKEVNALIIMAQNTKQFKDMLNDKLKTNDMNYKILMDKGCFVIDISLKTSVPLFGPYLNISTAAIPEINGDAQSVDLKYIKIGEVKLPGGVLQAQTQLIMGNLKSQKQYQDIIKAITLLKIEKGGNLVIRYRPFELRQALQQMLMEKVSPSLPFKTP